MLCAGQAKAQWPAHASSFVPPDHWAYSALRRLDAAGRLPSGSDVGRRSIPQEEIAALFQYAQQYLDEFRAEFPAARAFSARTSYTYLTGQVNAGSGYDKFWSGAEPVPDHKQVDASLRGAFNAQRVAASATLTRARFEELQLIATTKYVGAWLGRRELGESSGHGGGLVLNRHWFRGGGIYMTRPVNVPLLGPLRFESSLSRVRNRLNLNGQENPSKPFFWFARGSFEPIQAFRIGINRAMMFGGEGNLPITFDRLFNNIIGLNYTKNGENSFASQVLSVDGRLHPPVDWPLQLYLEWGVEDAAGGWWHQPGILGGAEVGITRDVLLGLERTEIAKNQGSNGLWYQNAWFQGSWADNGVLLGHPLGGNGREWRAFIYGGMPRLNGEFSLYTRERGSQNVFSPQREGRALGFFADLDVKLTQRSYASLRFEQERSRGDSAWSSTALRAAARVTF